MLTIWGRINSHNVKKVVWLAQELGLEYVRHDVGGAFGMDAAYLARNPNALIPTLQDGDVRLWESNAILRYLAARYGAGSIWQDDPAARATGDKWMDWQFSYAAAQLGAFWNLVRVPPEQRDNTAIAESARKTGAMMAILDDALGDQPWLSGERFGLGDIPMGVYANSWFKLDIPRPDRPNVRAWYERLLARPAYAAIAAIPLT